ncbi:MAG TPA: GNAT family N-acetyltransferase [Actinomycetota bacterium]|nr:GNAT family N-acetyltransferase [Actinomycetota bacterium]
MTTDDRLPPSAYSAARSSIEMWRIWAGSIPGARMEERPGAAAVVTGLDSVHHNGVWVARRRIRAATVHELLDVVEAADVPYALQLRGGAPPAVVGAARAHGMVLEAEEPLMVLTSKTRLHDAAHATGLSIRTLEPDEGALLASVTVPVFGGAAELTAASANARVLSHPAVRCYVGEVRDKIVATAIGVTLSGTTAIFDVATLPRHRRRGYGSALTARAVLDGLAAGARWAWLEASEGAVGVYERLGFRTVETGATWVRE